MPAQAIASPHWQAQFLVRTAEVSVGTGAVFVWRARGADFGVAVAKLCAEAEAARGLTGS